MAMLFFWQSFMMLLFGFHFLNLFFFATTFIWKLIVVFGANMCLMLEWPTKCHHFFLYKSRIFVKAISFHLLFNICFVIFLFIFWWHHFTIENCINWGATIMGDENPFFNGGIYDNCHFIFHHEINPYKKPFIINNFTKENCIQSKNKIKIKNAFKNIVLTYTLYPKKNEER